MTTTARIFHDQSLLSRIDRRLFRLEHFLALISGVAVFMLMFLAVGNVAGRNFFKAPLPGYIDWIEQCMPFIAFIGIAYCQRVGGHIRMELLLTLLRPRWLWAVEAIGVIIILCLVILMIWGSWAHFSRSFDWTAPLFSRDSSVDIRLPLWPAKLIVPCAFSIMALRLALQLWGYMGAIFRNDPRPAAVPLLASAAEIAAEEAASVSGSDIGDRSANDGRH